MEKRVEKGITADDCKCWGCGMDLVVPLSFKGGPIYCAHCATVRGEG